VVAGIGAALLIGAALQQAATARRRHKEQTDADRQGRITESFAKAVEQLGSDKLEVRLGGIYSLERISKESPDDYWTVMENLTAFVREHSRRNEAERTAQDLEGEPPATDITAALSVLTRRSERGRELERVNNWCLNLTGAILKQARLRGAHLEGADLSHAHLERAYLPGARLEGADLSGAHLEGALLGQAHLEKAHLREAYLREADLSGARLEEAELWHAHLERANLGQAHLEEANLSGAHLQGAHLGQAHLEEANLSGAHLQGAIFSNYREGTEANLSGAHLAGAVLSRAEGLSEANLAKAHGDAATRLPAGLTRPAHWLTTDLIGDALRLGDQLRHDFEQNLPSNSVFRRRT
jgi:uncharacterized protein YjbI with pentapeptide repeats